MVYKLRSNISSIHFLNGSLKVIDCGIACFSRSDSMVDIGTRIKASITFNKGTFAKRRNVVEIRFICSKLPFKKKYRTNIRM